jgi:hypothetical protein
MLIFQLQKQLQPQAQKQRLFNEDQCFLKGNNSTIQDYIQNDRESNSSRKYDRRV